MIARSLESLEEKANTGDYQEQCDLGHMYYEGC